MNNNMKALYIVVNAGFAEQVVEYIRTKGSTGATIINARGISSLQKDFLGMSIDREKEVILTVIESEKADIIIDTINHDKLFKTEAHGICFTLPVTKTVGITTEIANE